MVAATGSLHGPRPRILYCLAVAAQRTNMGIILPSVLSNHHHTGMWDPEGRDLELTEYFHKFTAGSRRAPPPAAGVPAERHSRD